MSNHVSLEELVRQLPEGLKIEVFDFASYLLTRQIRKEDQEWTLFSLDAALRGLDEEAPYAEADLQERWR